MVFDEFIVHDPSQPAGEWVGIIALAVKSCGISCGDMTATPPLRPLIDSAGLSN